MGTVVAGVYFLVFGLFLLRAGRRGRREGHAPHCAKCDYNLTGLTGGRCPECGAQLGPDAVVRGQKHRLPVVVVTGMLLSAGSLFFIGKGLYDSVRQDVFWFRLCPTRLLENLTQSPNLNTVQKAWKELEQRFTSGKLDAEQTGRVIDLALKSMCKPSLVAGGSSCAGVDRSFSTGDLGPPDRTLLAAVAKGHASPAQQERFFRSWVAGDLLVRTRVRQGDLVPYSVRAVSYGVWMKPFGFYGYIEKVSISLDNKLLGSNPIRDETRGAARSERFRHSGVLECNRPDKHAVQASVHAVFYTLGDNHELSEKPFHTTDVVYEAAFEVLAPPADSVRVKSSSSLKAQIVSTVAVEKLSLAPEGIEGLLKVKQPPEALAFDVVVRVNNAGYPAGRLTAGNRDAWWLTRESSYEGMVFRIAAKCPSPANSKCDIILRSNPDRARETVDIFEMWDGELEFKDVAVETRD